MLYELTTWLDARFDLPGFGVFRFLTFRAAVAAVFALGLAYGFGRWWIRYLKRRTIGESIRQHGPASHQSKAGTPTMGGVIILVATLLPTLLWADVASVYVLLGMLALAWMAAIGFLDDYIKVFRKDKAGLRGKFKLLGQVVLGLAVGLTLVLHPAFHGADGEWATQTNLPFLKDLQFDYAWLVGWAGPSLLEPLTRGVYVLMTVFIVAAVSNGVNITDGLDGLAAGTTALVVAALGVMAYITGNAIWAEYLNVAFLPRSGELFVFAAALVGGCVGFLWFNAHPAQVFMGDTGSLALGGAVGVMAIMIKKELMLPLICAVFFVESLSVIIQVGYFKYTKRRTGQGRRVFRMAPLHHHYEQLGLHESKIVTRFWIVTALLALLAFATLKLR